MITVCAAVRAVCVEVVFLRQKQVVSLADDHVKERFRLDAGPDWPKPETTKIAGLAHP